MAKASFLLTGSRLIKVLTFWAAHQGCLRKNMAKGVGYSSYQQKGWDVKAYLAAQKEKDKQIELLKTMAEFFLLFQHFLEVWFKNLFLYEIDKARQHLFPKYGQVMPPIVWLLDDCWHFSNCWYFEKGKDRLDLLF